MIIRWQSNIAAKVGSSKYIYGRQQFLNSVVAAEGLPFVPPSITAGARSIISDQETGSESTINDDATGAFSEII